MPEFHFLPIRGCDFQNGADDGLHGELFGRNLVSDGAEFGTVECFNRKTADFLISGVKKCQSRLIVLRVLRIRDIEQFEADWFSGAVCFPRRKNQRRNLRVVARIRARRIAFQEVGIVTDQALKGKGVAESRLEAGVFVEFVPFEEHDEIRIKFDQTVQLEAQPCRTEFAVCDTGHMVDVGVSDYGAEKLLLELFFPHGFLYHREQVPVVDSEIGFRHIVVFAGIDCKGYLDAVEQGQDFREPSAVFLLCFGRPFACLGHLNPILPVDQEFSGDGEGVAELFAECVQKLLHGFRFHRMRTAGIQDVPSPVPGHFPETG